MEAILIEPLLKNKELVKAIVLLLGAVVFVAGVDPVLVWAVLNMPPENLSVPLSAVYVWWAGGLSGLITFAIINALVKERKE